MAHLVQQQDQFEQENLQNKQLPFVNNYQEAHYDSVINMDQKLKELEEQARLMEEEYGFNQKMIVQPTQQEQNPNLKLQKNNSKNNTKKQANLSQTQKNSTGLLKYQKNDTRYRQLVPVQSQEQQQIQMNSNQNQPELSKKWQTISKEKPDIMAFFDSDLYKPVFLDKQDFQTSANFDNDFTEFNNTMSKYALKL